MRLSKKLPLLVASILLMGELLLPLGCKRNNPPMQPSDPEPPDGATVPAGSVTLCWCGGDPDPELPYYDLYFGNSTPPPLKEVNLLERHCEITGLDTNTIYYWMIVAQDEQGDTAAGPIWSLSTTSWANNNPPLVPSDPHPSDGARGQPRSLTLHWSGGDPDPELCYYDLYFGNTDPPPLKEVNLLERYCEITDLDSNTTYYWMIVAQDEQDETAAGPIWSFTTTRGDSYEPNDCFNSAYGPLVFGTVYESWIWDWEDHFDFYYFIPDTSGIVRIYLHDLPADYNLNLYNESQERLAFSMNYASIPESISYHVIESNIYYVGVFQYGPADSTDSYLLEVDYMQGHDSFEPNNSFDEAYGPLDLGTIYKSWISTLYDVDVYYFVPPIEDRIVIDLYTLPANYNLALYDSSYDLIALSENEDTASERIEFDASASETYYVSVYSYGEYDAFDSYYLRVHYSEALQSWGLMPMEKRNLKID